MKTLTLGLLLLTLVGCHRKDGVRPTNDNSIQREEEYDSDDFKEAPSNLNTQRGTSEADAMNAEILPPQKN
jgi:hypothetical protein